MGVIVPFQSRRRREASAEHVCAAHIIILPVVRIERYGEHGGSGPALPKRAVEGAAPAVERKFH